MPSPRMNDDAAETVAREAAEWFVRLNNPLVGEDDRRAFHTWITADPAHAAAFQETQDLWSKLGKPAARLGAGGWHRRSNTSSRRPVRRMFAAAAAAALVIAGGLLWRDIGLIDRAFADYSTRPGERGEFLLADGTQVYLDGDTAITRSFAPNHREVTILRGRVWFDVAPDPSRPFSVHAGSIETRVLGTAFSVDRAAANVTVEHGTVSVSAGRDQDDAVQLTEGERVGVSRDRLGLPAHVDPDVASAWRRGLIVLDSAPLGDVVDELGRMAPGRVIIPDDELRSLTLSGVFRADDPDAVIEAMRTALGLKTISVPGLATLVYR